jgi:hypothetical protein
MSSQINDMNRSQKATWTSFDETKAADREAVVDYEREFNAGLVDRLLAQFQPLDIGDVVASYSQRLDPDSH